MEANLSMKLEHTESPDRFLAYGRGELQMAILIEQMRREGYEFAVGMPQVITKEVDGKTHEPYERTLIDVPDEFMGIVIEKMGSRKGQMTKMDPDMNERKKYQMRKETEAVGAEGADEIRSKRT